jgi:hypothetical protein
VRREESVADVVVVYAREDRQSAVRIVQFLREKRWSVWWDGELRAGEYRRHIERELNSCRCVLVLWSSTACNRSFVRDEANRGLLQEKLAQATLDGANAPLGFGEHNVVDLQRLDIKRSQPKLITLHETVESIVHAPKARGDGLRDFPRLAQTQFPLFVRSVSSHETLIRPGVAIKALEVFSPEAPEALLVSAYDLAGDDAESLRRGTNRCYQTGAVVFIDSGNYEAYRRRDASWSRERYAAAFGGLRYDFAFAFDKPEPRGRAKAISSAIIDGVRRDAEQLASERIIPIVHAPREARGDYRTSLIADIAQRVCAELKPAFIAVPERELGHGIVARATAVARLRRAVEEARPRQLIHLLGTGNPISLAVLAAAGADSFDGLEWCRIVADHSTGYLHHPQHYDFFAYQDQVATLRVVHKQLEENELSYIGKLALHNLDYFHGWIIRVRKALESPADMKHFLESSLPKGAYVELAQATPEVFT